jgi:aminopeptidase N
MFLFAEKITFNEYLSLLRRFIDESGTLPAKEVSNQLALLYELIPDQVIDLSTKFHRSQLNILQSKTDQNSTMLLGIIASRLSLIDPEYANILGGEFRRYRDATPDMKLAIVTAYARSTNDFDSLSEEYRKSGSDEDKDRLLNAMTAFTDEATLQKTFDFAFSGAVKRQDVRYVIIYAIEKPQAKALAWACLQSNIEKLQSLYKNTGTLSDTLQLAIPILGIGRTHEVKRFFEENKIPEADAGIKAGVEKLLAYDQFVNRITRG